MQKGTWLIIHLILGFVLNVNAQPVLFSDDGVERGYYNRPYQRYEAEPGKCETNGSFQEPTFDQRKLQSEASNQSAVLLTQKDDWVQWTLDEPADGITIRFSLPDSNDGRGTKDTLALYAGEVFLQNIILDSYWAWQYILKSGSKYPDNIPDSSTKFPRMRFDEIHLKLPGKVAGGSALRLVKSANNSTPCTIDFIEMEEVPEPVTFESIQGENKVEYTPEKGKLQYFVIENSGKTIFIPPGRYEVDGRIVISGDGTKLLGAGMWHTELFFTASSDDRGTFNRRGIETGSSHVVVEGICLNTVNNKRYFDNNVIYQVGKGLMGSFGSGSVIRNVWIEHFECGGWIEGADNLNITHSRFRNNYADGINLAYGSKNSKVEHCSFRNNGDDDMASWSRADRLCENNTFRYCTSENNWRASALGFFGGKQNKAENIVIIDPMEAGFRVTSDFPGVPFSSEGFSEFSNISVYNGGVTNGVPGIYGDLWGNRQGAIHLFSSSQYDVQNIIIREVDLYNSKDNAVFIGSSSKYIRNLRLNDIRIHGAGRYGLYFHNAKGNGNYCNIQYDNIGADFLMNSIPAAFSFTEDCSTVSVPVRSNPALEVTSLRGGLKISGKENLSVSVYDISGRIHYHSQGFMGEVIISDLVSGVYVLRWSTNKFMKVMVY